VLSIAKASGPPSRESTSSLSRANLCDGLSLAELMQMKFLREIAETKRFSMNPQFW
jgi:hypothetical protein